MSSNERWRIRRRLIFGAVGFGALMIAVGAAGLFADRFTDSMIYGGVTIITGAISAYAGFATYDDVKYNGSGENPDG